MDNIWFIYGSSWLSHSSEKDDFVTWDDEFPNICKNNKCSKPTTRYLYDSNEWHSKHSLVNIHKDCIYKKKK